MSANTKQSPKTYNKHYNTTTLANIALYVAILCVSSYIVIPLPFTPVVLSIHTVMVNLIGLIMKPKHAAITISVYLIMGLIGLPVFSGGTSGPGKLFGPTGGFYFGFLFSALLISLLKGKSNNLMRFIIITILIGLPVQHLCAVLLMSVHNGFNIQAALAAVSFPFIPGDIIKCVLASFIGVSLNKHLFHRALIR